MATKLLPFIVVMLLSMTSSVYAQRTAQQVPADTKTEADTTVKPQTTQTVGTDYYKYNRMSEVIQSSGKVYNAQQMERMPAKDIRSIANTVPGVQARTGEEIIIRGAPYGTAIFVDGVRVYGTLPLIYR